MSLLGVLVGAPAAQAGLAAAPAAFGLGPLFLFFLKVGAVLFGSGYVLLAFLRADLVERWHWLTEAQLLDAVAVGQVTPGPVFTTATFIGYVLDGPRGALVTPGNSAFASALRMERTSTRPNELFSRPLRLWETLPERTTCKRAWAISGPNQRIIRCCFDAISDALKAASSMVGGSDEDP